MGVLGALEAASRIVQLGGTPGRIGRVAEMRARFEARTGSFGPEDTWFEERSRAFWCDAVTRGRFGREVRDELDADAQGWLAPLERSHRGLFRTDGQVLVDVWSGAEFDIARARCDEATQAELGACAGQLFDARIVGSAEPSELALLPGAVFHSPDATLAIEPVLVAARQRAMSTGDVLDALLRMACMQRSLSRVRAGYAYRAEALSPRAAALASPG